MSMDEDYAVSLPGRARPRRTRRGPGEPGRRHGVRSRHRSTRGDGRCCCRRVSHGLGEREHHRDRGRGSGPGGLWLGL